MLGIIFCAVLVETKSIGASNFQSIINAQDLCNGAYASAKG